MSRSKKGSKGPGFEFWSRRPMAFWVGSWAKTKCHRIERAQKRQLIHKEIQQL